jgi:hypothetical protein
MKRAVRWALLSVGLASVVTAVTVAVTVAPSWATPPSGLTNVQQGSITVHQSAGSQCQTTTYSAGQAFIERPGEVDDVTNAGTGPYVLFVTFPRVPQGDSPRTDQPDPGTCPGL